MSDEIPRRARIDKMTFAERAILLAIWAVEEMPADVRLTNAVIQLGQAQGRVADYVDGVASHDTDTPDIRVIDGCKHTMTQMMKMANQGACPICLTWFPENKAGASK